MSSAVGLVLALTLWLLIFSVTTCAQTGAVDSGQLVLTLRAPPNELKDIADPFFWRCTCPRQRLVSRSPAESSDIADRRASANQH